MYSENPPQEFIIAFIKVAVGFYGYEFQLIIPVKSIKLRHKDPVYLLESRFSSMKSCNNLGRIL